MRKVACRVCGEWFEGNTPGICSEACVKKRQESLPKLPDTWVVDKSWNEKLKRKKPVFLHKPQAPKKAKTRENLSAELLARLIKKNERKYNRDRWSMIARIGKRLGLPFPPAREVERKPQKTKKEPKKLNKYNKPFGFYDTRAWQLLRYEVLRKYGRKCMCCGQTEGQMHVDHIKPRSLHPELELVFENLQVLCLSCNMGKSNVDDTDFRQK